MQTIGKEIGVSIRTVQTEIAKLKKYGYLIVSRYHNGYRVNHYVFKIRLNNQFSRVTKSVFKIEQAAEDYAEHTKRASCVKFEHAKPTSCVENEHTKQASRLTGSRLRPNNISEKYSLSNDDHSSCGTDERLPDKWSRFYAAFPFHSGMPAGDARREFDLLDYQDQEAAIAGAATYATAVKSRGTRHPVFAAKWLRDREFERNATHAAAPLDNFPAPSSVFVEKDTPEWLAWRAWKGNTFPTIDGNVDGRRCIGWRFASRWPPGHPDQEKAS